MADFGAPVQMPEVNPSKALQTLSGLLQLKQQQQEIARGAATLQSEQQTTRQRAAIADFMGQFDITQHLGGDGTLSLDDAFANPDLRKAAGDKFPEIAQQLIAVKQGQLQAKSSLAALNQELRGQFLQAIGALRTDPDVVADNEAGRLKVQQVMGNFAESGGPDAARVAQIYGPMTDHAPKGKLAQALSIAQQQGMDVATQAGRQAPTFVDTGSKLAQTNPQAAGGDLTKDIPPGFDLFTDPRTGNSYWVNPQTKEVQDLGAHSGGKSSLPAPYYPGQAEDTKRFQDEVNSTRSAGDQAPLAANINQQILRLSKDASTGPGSEVWQHAIGALGAPFGLSPSSTYQEIGKFLEKNAINNMQSMGGPPSDARLSAAAAANGSTTFSPRALQDVTKFNDATTTALAQYRHGIDKAIGMGASTDYSKLPKFKSDWSKNLDINVFRVENAIRDGDEEALEQITKEIGPEGLKKLAEKRKNLQKLSADGKL